MKKKRIQGSNIGTVEEKSTKRLNYSKDEMGLIAIRNHTK
jgi:hypothetical protein